MLSLMSERKLLAFDLDQTIITDRHELPTPIRSAIRRARDAGHHVSVLTGRPLANTVPVLEQLDIDSWYSVNHGGMVFGKDGEVLRHQRLPWHDVTAVLETEFDNALEYSVVVGEKLYVRQPGDPRWGWAHTANRVVAEFTADLNSDVDKLVFSAGTAPTSLEDDSLLSVAEALEGVIAERFPHLVTYVWNNGYLEITTAESDKGSALRLLSAELGFRQEDTIAFGDGLNDRTMLEWAGRSIAVGPFAHARVLAVADEHIAPPEEGGVADWLERNLGV